MATRATSMSRPPLSSELDPTALPTLTKACLAAGLKPRLRLARASDKSRKLFWSAIDKSVGSEWDDPDVQAALAIGPDIVQRSAAGDAVRRKHAVHEILVGPRGRFIGVWFDKGQTRFIYILDSAVKETLSRHDETSRDAQSLNAFTNALCQIVDGTFEDPNGELPQDRRPRVYAPGTDRLMRNPRHASITEAKFKDKQALVVTAHAQIDLLTKAGRMAWAIASLIHSDEAETIAARNLVGELNRLRRGRYPRSAKAVMLGYRRLGEDDLVPDYLDWDRAQGCEGMVIPNELQRDAVCRLWWWSQQDDATPCDIADDLGRNFGITSRDNRSISVAVLMDLDPADRALLSRLNVSEDPKKWVTKPLHLLSDGGKYQTVAALYQPHKIITYATGAHAAEWAGRVANQFVYEGGHTMTPRVGESNDRYGSVVYTVPFDLPQAVELDRTTGLSVRGEDGEPIYIDVSGRRTTRSGAARGWGPSYDDWLDVLVRRSLRAKDQSKQRRMPEAPRLAHAGTPTWEQDGREWQLAARRGGNNSAGYVYLVRSRPLQGRQDELGRYRSWPSPGAKDDRTSHEFTLCSADFDRRFAAALATTCEGVVLGRLPVLGRGTGGPPDAGVRERALAAAVRVIDTLQQRIEGLRVVIAELNIARTQGVNQVNGMDVEDLDRYVADRAAAKQELDLALRQHTRLSREPEPATDSADFDVDFGDAAWVAAGVKRFSGQPTDRRLSAAVSRIFTVRRITRLDNDTSALIEFDLELPLASGGALETTGQFQMADRRRGPRARPDGKAVRNEALVRSFLRDGLSIAQITQARDGAFTEAQVHRFLKAGLEALLPGPDGFSARKHLRHYFTPMRRQAAYHALADTSADERPDWLGAEYDEYLRLLAATLRTGQMNTNDVAHGTREVTLDRLMWLPDPAAGLPVAVLADTLDVRIQKISNQALATTARGALQPPTLAKVAYFDRQVPLGPGVARVRPIRCAHQDCPQEWATEVAWFAEVLALGTGVICQRCRRPSKVVYRPGEAGQSWQVTDVPAATFAIPRWAD